MGSVVRTGDHSTELILDTDLSADEVLDFYDEQMPGRGWKTLPAAMGGGFTSAPFTSSAYCSEEGDTNVWINANALAGGTTDLRLTISIDQPFSPCDQTAGPGGDLVNRMMPTLNSPPGAAVQGGGMSSSGDAGDMSATVETTLSAADFGADLGGAPRSRIPSPPMGEVAQW